MLAEELVQETYRKALAAANKPSPATEEATRAWLFTILRNHWHNELRQRSRQTRIESLDELQISAEPVDIQVSRKLLLSEVRDAIDALPEPFREVVVLRDIEGLSYAEIAHVVACPSGTVMSRLSRAREILRRSLCAAAPNSHEVER
jgi:RNA polymerase sigma-70 factor (ECF subfamily)